MAMAGPATLGVREWCHCPGVQGGSAGRHKEAQTPPSMRRRAWPAQLAARGNAISDGEGSSLLEGLRLAVMSSCAGSLGTGIDGVANMTVAIGMM